MSEPSTSRGITDELRRKLDDLECMEREVQEQINQARSMNKMIDKYVLSWLDKARDARTRVQSDWFGVGIASSSASVRKSSPYQHKPLKSRENVFELIISLVDQGKSILSVSSAENPQGIELVWRDGFVDFKSRRSASNEIKEGLKDEDIRIIGISGMGGIGKTKLVVEIGKIAKHEKLFDQVVIATVSQKPNIKYIQGVLADMLGIRLEKPTETGRATEIQGALTKERRILVILDDVWENFDMKTIGIPSQSAHKGCKIIITTRQLEVCNAMGCRRVVRLDWIDEDESWALFCNYAGQPGKSICTKAKLIVRECRGLPLGLVVVGSSLKAKTSSEEYGDALQRLQSSNFVHLESVDKDIYASIKLSYDYLEDDETKKCFLFCSMYPEDSEVSVEDLTRYAYSLDLFQSVHNVDEARKRILATIKHLENACLLTPVQDKEHIYSDFDFVERPRVKMHDIVRDVALWIAKDYGAFFISPTSLQELQSKHIPENATALSFKVESDYQFRHKLEYPDLKSLIIKAPATRFPDNFFEKATILQTLDLSFFWNQRAAMVSFPESLRNLGNLKSLHISAEHIRNLPIIGKLKSLEILVLGGGQLVELPVEIGELCSLRVLDLSRWQRLKRIPHNLLSRFVKLEELYTPLIGCKGGIIDLSELRSLPLTAFMGKFLSFESLPRDFMFGELQRHSIVCFAGISTKVTGHRWSRSINLDGLCDLALKVFAPLLPAVEHFSIDGPIWGYRNLFPEISDSGFQNLRELHLKDSVSLDYLIDTKSETSVDSSSPQRLPGDLLTHTVLRTGILAKLVCLNLHNMARLRKLCNGPLPLDCLENLKEATFSSCPGLAHIVPGMLPVGQQLYKLKIRDCTELKAVYDFEVSEFLRTKEYLSLLPCPTVMELYGLSKLDSILQGSIQNCCFHRLERIQLTGCDTLTTLFTPALAQSLVKLRCIRISHCAALETLISTFDGHKSFQHSSSSASQVILPEIMEIDVHSCQTLTRVLVMHFDSRSLLKLERLSVQNCLKLSQVFDLPLNKAGTGTLDSNHLILKNLNSLTLTKLPALVSLLPEGCHVIAPSLSRIEVENWEKISFQIRYFLPPDDAHATEEVRVRRRIRFSFRKVLLKLSWMKHR